MLVEWDVCARIQFEQAGHFALGFIFVQDFDPRLFELSGLPLNLLRPNIGRTTNRWLERFQLGFPHRLLHDSWSSATSSVARTLTTISMAGARIEGTDRGRAP